MQKNGKISGTGGRSDGPFVLFIYYGNVCGKVCAAAFTCNILSNVYTAHLHRRTSIVEKLWTMKICPRRG